MTAASRQTRDLHRLAVVTTPELGIGYRLAGVATRTATSSEEAVQRLSELVAESGGEAIVAVHEPFLLGLAPPARRRLEESVAPLIVALPAGEAQVGESERRKQLQRMLWQAVGYQMTFEPRQQQ